MKASTSTLGIAFLVMLSALALHFYLERTAFVDIAFHLFYILKDGSLAIQNNRFVATLTQAVPLISSKLGFSLDSIMMLYSLSFIVLQLAIYLIITKLLKSTHYGLILIATYLLMITHTFFWIQSELPQGINLLILYFAILDYQAKSGNKAKLQLWMQPLQYILVITLIFAHPLIIFGFMFIGVYLWLHHEDRRQLYTVSLITFSVLYYIKSLFFKTVYDEQSIKGLDNFKAFFPNYFDIPSNAVFFKSMLTHYYFLGIGFLLLMWWFAKKKHFLKLLFVAGSFIGYLLLVNVSYPSGAETFYLENLYLPLSLIIGVPLVLDLVPTLQAKHLVMILGVMMIVRLGDICISSSTYTKRMDNLSSIIDNASKTPNAKQIIAETPALKKELIMTWGTPYETWLLSSRKGGATKSILITPQPKELEWTISNTKAFITPWGVFEYKDLPNSYFHFIDYSPYVMK